MQKSEDNKEQKQQRNRFSDEESYWEDIQQKYYMGEMMENLKESI